MRLSILCAATFALACSSTVVVQNKNDAGLDASATGGSATGGKGGATATGGGTSTGASTGTGGAGMAGSGGAACPTGLQGPPLVKIDSFCIDATEVTNAQYAKFVTAKNGDTSGQVAGCTDNTTFVPTSYWPAATDAMNQPVVYVNWCDAMAYCSWAGKRLCGKIGGGSNPYDAYADELRSEWYDACSNGGRNTYPYGGTYVDGACNGYNGPNGCLADSTKTPGDCSFADVGTYKNCHGAGEYAGVFDMSGNAMEWEDSCGDLDAGVTVCRIRGGSIYAQVEDQMACNDDDSEGRSYTAPAVGFRCCSK